MRRFEIRTVVASGPLALAARRLAAANAGEVGLQIMDMERLAAHLAGGFLRPAASSELDAAIGSALGEGGLDDLRGLPEAPGAVRAVKRTLQRIWAASLPLGELAAGHPRLADLALLDRRVRAALPCGSLVAPELVRAATQRLHLSDVLVGPLEFASLPHVAPVWRGLVAALGESVPITWSGPAPHGSEDLPGKRVAEDEPEQRVPEAVACADARSEALEALRWVRELISSGCAAPGDVAVAAADPRAWDDAILAARAHAGLPLHFSHGVPALETRSGQACAALADLLQHGLSQERVRRVLARCSAGAPGLATLPDEAMTGIARNAALSEMEHWQAALAAALPVRTDGRDLAPCLMPLLRLAARGLAAADEAGRLFLPPRGYDLWAEALRRAPHQALPITLGTLRSGDDRHPGDSVTWGPASHLAAAPRPFVRLLGLNAREWPRQDADDPILPAHLIDPGLFGVPAVLAQDLAAFAAIRRGATGALVLSRSRRNARGSHLPPSPLLPIDSREETLERNRIPPHAASPADRLLARPAEAAAHERVSAAVACADARRSTQANAHDGLLPADHALVVRALAELQSATKLRLLLRDPQGYVWQHVLHWSSPLKADRDLALDARAHGELVHEILRDAVDALEAGPGLCRADVATVAEAVDAAASSAFEAWPPRRPTPPRLLWAAAVNLAAVQARRALGLDIPLQASTRSVTEVTFGRQDGLDPERSPWDAGLPVAVPGGCVAFGGSIDRLDLRGDGAVQVTDYKTGAVPRKPVAIDGGRELQRVMYALAVRTLLPGSGKLRARLVYLAGSPAVAAELHGIDQAIADVSSYVSVAAASLVAGVSLPGPDAEEEWSDRRLGLPAVETGYLVLKRLAFDDAFGDACQVWRAP